jgi:DNA/RNA endonuclease YhcR with UshA esterase domain
MRALLMAAALLAAITGQDAKTIAPEEAAMHVGETTIVEGIVSHVKVDAHDGSILLDFGPAYPNQVFTAYIVAANAKNYPNPEKLLGKTVLVNGKIALYKGKPEIKVTGALQLQIVS